MDFWIWRDAIDKETYMIGVKRKSGSFMAWATLYIDAISDMLGRDFSESIKYIEPGEPVQVVGTIGRK